MESFDFEKYCEAMRNFGIYARDYVICEGTNCYLPEDAPESAKIAYENSLYWSRKRTEWERITGERFV